MTDPAGTSRTAVLVAAFDSQLKWAAMLNTALESRGFSSRAIIPSDLRHAISRKQAAVTDAPIDSMPWDTMVDVVWSSDVVVMAMHGPLVERLSHDLYRRSRATGQAPPVVVAGWVGVIIENVTGGYLRRLAADVMPVNSRGDLRTFEQVAASLGVPTDNLVLSGLPLLTDAKPSFEASPPPPRTVLFADQPTVPETHADRLYVYDRLISYARKHPDRRVLLKPRHTVDEDTFHPMKFHPETLLKGRKFPPNFSIDYTPISEQLSSIDLMLTVSSTALLEGLGAGVRGAIITDLGIRERLGNQIFVESGLLRTFDQIEQDDIGEPTDAFLDDYFFALDGVAPAERVAERVTELVELRHNGGETPQMKVWQSAMFQAQQEIISYRSGNQPSKPHPAEAWLRRRGRLLAEALLPAALSQKLRRRR